MPGAAVGVAVGAVPGAAVMPAADPDAAPPAGRRVSGAGAGAPDVGAALNWGRCRQAVNVVLVALVLAGCRSAQPLTPVAMSPTAMTKEEAPGTGAPASAAVDELVEGLRGLPFEDFLAQSYDLLLARSPEQVTALDAADRLGARNDRLDDLSGAYVGQTHALQRALLDLLRDYDRGTLAPDVRLSYDIYAWYLDDLVRGQPFAEHDYPITHCRVGTTTGC